MKRKTKKLNLRTFLRSNTTSALAVILLCGSLGTVVLPQIFADTTYNVTNVSATASNDATQSITVTWGGTTPDHWQGQVLLDNKIVDSWQSTDKTKTFVNMICGVEYTFMVAASGPNNGVRSSFAGDTATTLCPDTN